MVVFLFLSEMSVNKSTLCSWNAEGMADDCTHVDGYKNVHAEEVEEETRRSPYGSPLPDLPCLSSGGGTGSHGQLGLDFFNVL